MEAKEKIYLIFGDFKDKLPTSLYVGKTRQELDQRFRQHIKEVKDRLEGYKNWNIKYRWMWEMIDRDQEVRIMLLNKAQRSKIYTIEKEWIYYLGLHNFNMINKANFMYYKKKVFTI